MRSSHPFAAQAYDLVIRARPDLMWCSDVNLTAALHVAQERNVVLVPFAEDQLARAPRHRRSGAERARERVSGAVSLQVFDQVAIAAPAAMAAYASGYEATLAKEIARDPRRGLYPEHEMYRHFRNLKLKPLTMRGFRSALVRKDDRGRPFQEDGYVKLRKDYSDLANVAMPDPVDHCPLPTSGRKKRKRKGGRSWGDAARDDAA